MELELEIFGRLVTEDEQGECKTTEARVVVGVKEHILSDRQGMVLVVGEVFERAGKCVRDILRPAESDSGEDKGRGGSASHLDPGEDNL